MTKQDRTLSKVIRLEPDGPDGLKPMTLDPDDFHEVPTEQTLHVYFDDPDLGMSVGVWETQPMQEAFGPYPGDEFIYVLSGHFDMRDTVDGSGENVSCSAGQSVIFRNGIPVSWKQYDVLRKFYITYMDPQSDVPQGLSAKGGIQALDPDLTLTDADILEQSETRQREKVFFTNDHGNFEVGLWDTEAMTAQFDAFPNHEFVQILEGDVIITHTDGTSEAFGAGDVFFLPAGTACTWEVPKYVRKFFAALDPSIRPGG